jgi:hypothetical protein
MCCQLCVQRIFDELKKIRKGVKKTMSAISEFATKANAAFTTVNAALDNIVADEAALAKQISDLQAQIAAGNSVLTPEDQAALDGVVTAGTALAAKVQSIADAIPDLPAPPPGV